jgi:hypothetical protein
VVDQVVSEPFSTAEFPLTTSEMVRIRVTSETCCRLRIGFLFPMPSAELKYQ